MDPVFVGRAVELARLDELLLASLNGRGGTALLVGEPGIGKTCLTVEIAGRAERAGALCR